MPSAIFRFHAELNDFLPRPRRHLAFRHRFKGQASVKDRIEAIGPPHPEVELILVNGSPVTFAYLVGDGDQIGVYPRYPAAEGSRKSRLRPERPAPARFVLDTHLGKLASFLRMLGFDALYRNDYDDDELAALSSNQNRILLTRDVGLLKRREVVHGHWVRSLMPREQMAQVILRFELQAEIRPFHRCLNCNGVLRPVSKEQILDRLEPRTRIYYDEFHRCPQCDRIYWKGSHYERMARLVHRLEERGQMAGSW